MSLAFAGVDGERRIREFLRGSRIITHQKFLSDFTLYLMPFEASLEKRL